MEESEIWQSPVGFSSWDENPIICISWTVLSDGEMWKAAERFTDFTDDWARCTQGAGMT